MLEIGTPFSAAGKKALLLGSGELGKEVTIELQRYRIKIHTNDSRSKGRQTQRHFSHGAFRLRVILYRRMEFFPRDFLLSDDYRYNPRYDLCQHIENESPCHMDSWHSVLFATATAVLYGLVRIVASAPSTAAAPQMPEPIEVSNAVSRSILRSRPIQTPPNMVTVTMMVSITMAANPTSATFCSVRRNP